MKKIAALFLLTCVNMVMTMPSNCSGTASSQTSFDTFCATTPSQITGCLCAVYREQIVELYTLAVCQFTPFVGNFTGDGKNLLADILRLPQVIQSLTNVLIPKHLDLFCPGASNFQACLNRNLTSSQQEIDLIVKTFLGPTLSRYMVDMCNNREAIKDSVACMKDLTLPAVGCVGLTLVPQINSLGIGNAVSGPELYTALQENICPVIGDLASCLAIQVDAVCSSAFSIYFNNQESYLSPDCQRSSSKNNTNLGNSVFLQCGLTTLSKILTNATSLNYITTDQTDIPAIIRLSTQFVCSDVANYLDCVASNIAPSNTLIDRWIQGVLDFRLISRQTSAIQTALCGQQTTTGSSGGASSGSDSGSSSGANSGSDSGSSSGANSGSDSGSSSGVNSGSDSGSSSGANSGSDSGSSTGSNTGSNSGSSNNTCGPGVDYATSNEARALRTTIFGLIGVIVVLVLALIAAVVSFIIARKHIEQKLAISALRESEVKNPGYEMLDQTKREMQAPNIYDRVE